MCLWRDSISSRAVLQPRAILGSEVEQTEGERGSEFLLTRLGLPVRLPRGLLLPHPAKVWEREILSKVEKQGLSTLGFYRPTA